MLDEGNVIQHRLNEANLALDNENAALPLLVRELLEVNKAIRSRVVEQQSLVAEEIIALRARRSSTNTVRSYIHRVFQRVV
jgi:hypothetical protein